MDRLYTIASLEELQEVATQFLKEHDEARIFAFQGQMGAGKTTFILSLLKAMGIEEPEGSPTYSLVNTYESVAYGPIYHFDMYRLKDEHEALDSGMEEMIDSGSYCFIEWPEKIQGILPLDVVKVRITVNKEGVRVLSVQS